MGNRRPKIGVCALNPHAGESGLLGLEEIKVIGPAVHQLKKEFYDCLITMYHDQSLIPLKLFNSDKLINITLGLPFPRTSPGHGTACEIAGKNCANPEPMVEAILTAARLASK